MPDFGPSKHAAPATTELDVTIAITDMLDDALVADRKAKYEASRGSGSGEVAKKRIGAGYIGVECARALAFKFHKIIPDERDSVVSPGELQRHAESGHWTEESTAEWLVMAGIELKTFQTDESGQPLMGYNGEPRQFGFHNAQDPETGQFRMAGEVDGIIVGVPDKLKALILLEGGVIWESKKATNKKWTKFKKGGVRKADPKYYGQIQTCMAYMGVARCLFSMLNLDNMKYFFEVVEYDQATAQRLTDRAVKVMESNHPNELPRAANNPTIFICKFCDYHQTCWKEPEAPANPYATETPNWLSQ